MALVNVSDYATAPDEGRLFENSFRKVPTQTVGTAGQWTDLSQAAGNPPAQYFAGAPLEALNFNPYRGIFHGPSQGEKRLTRLGVMTPKVGMGRQTRLKLLDYLLAYPFIDASDLAEQVMDNATGALTHYTDGAGVQVMAVAQTPSAGGGTFTFTYVNQDGVTKTSPTQTFGASSNIATILCSNPTGSSQFGPFLILDGNDSGVRSITGVQIISDGGCLFALVLVKQLASFEIEEINAPYEIDYIAEHSVPPEIGDGAYLALICSPKATIAGALLAGYYELVWSD
jgi:hypothetical protein